MANRVPVAAVAQARAHDVSLRTVGATAWTQRARRVQAKGSFFREVRVWLTTLRCRLDQRKHALALNPKNALEAAEQVVKGHGW